MREKLGPLQKELDAAKKQGKAGRAKVKELSAKIHDGLYTAEVPEEQRILKIGKASQGFHYLGSAKIYGRIGEAFAKALINLKSSP